MNSEEGMIINTNRKGHDTRMDDPALIMEESAGSAPNMRYNGTHECEMAVPAFNDCVDLGAEISSWISERLLNNSQMCN